MARKFKYFAISDNASDKYYTKEQLRKDLHTFGNDEEVKVYTLANVEDEQELTSEDLLFIWKNGKIIKSYMKPKKTPKKEGLSLKESPRYKDLVKLNDTTWKYKDKVTIGYNEYGKYYFVIEPDELDWMYSGESLKDLLNGIDNELKDKVDESMKLKESMTYTIFYTDANGQSGAIEYNDYYEAQHDLEYMQKGIPFEYQDVYMTSSGEDDEYDDYDDADYDLDLYQDEEETWYGDDVMEEDLLSEDKDTYFDFKQKLTNAKTLDELQKVWGVIKSSINQLEDKEADKLFAIYKSLKDVLNESLKEDVPYAPLKDRKPYRVFVKGDRVKYVNNNGWTKGGERHIGETGTIVDNGWQGNLQVFTIKMDNPRIDEYGYEETTFSAHPDNLEYFDESLKEARDYESEYNITPVDKKKIIQWWKDMATFYEDSHSKNYVSNIDDIYYTNNVDDIDGWLISMFDSLSDLSKYIKTPDDYTNSFDIVDRAKDLLRRGKSLYNKYAPYSKFNYGVKESKELKEKLESGDCAYHKDRDEYFYLKDYKTNSNGNKCFELYTYNYGKFNLAHPRFVDENSPFYNQLVLKTKRAVPQWVSKNESLKEWNTGDSDSDGLAYAKAIEKVRAENETKLDKLLKDNNIKVNQNATEPGYAGTFTRYSGVYNGHQFILDLDREHFTHWIKDLIIDNKLVKKYESSIENTKLSQNNYWGILDLPKLLADENIKNYTYYADNDYTNLKYRIIFAKSKNELSKIKKDIMNYFNNNQLTKRDVKWLNDYLGKDNSIKIDFDESLKEDYFDDKEFITLPEEEQAQFEQLMNDNGWVLDDETAKRGSKNFYDAWFHKEGDGAKDIHYQFITKDTYTEDEWDELMDNTFDLLDECEKEYNTRIRFSAGLINDGSKYNGRGTIGIDIDAPELIVKGEDKVPAELAGHKVRLKNGKPHGEDSKKVIKDIEDHGFDVSQMGIKKDESLNEGDQDVSKVLGRKLGKLLPPKQKPKRRYVYEVYYFTTPECDGDPVYRKFSSRKAQQAWYDKHCDDPDKFGMYAWDDAYIEENLKEGNGENVFEVVDKYKGYDIEKSTMTIEVGGDKGEPFDVFYVVKDGKLASWMCKLSDLDTLEKARAFIDKLESKKGKNIKEDIDDREHYLCFDMDKESTERNIDFEEFETYLKDLTNKYNCKVDDEESETYIWVTGNETNLKKFADAFGLSDDEYAYRKDEGERYAPLYTTAVEVHSGHSEYMTDKDYEKGMKIIERNANKYNMIKKKSWFKTFYFGTKENAEDFVNSCKKELDDFLWIVSNYGETTDRQRQDFKLDPVLAQSLESLNKTNLKESPTRPKRRN